MKCHPDTLRAVPLLHSGRNWEGCNWFSGDTELFHERTYWPHSWLKLPTSEQWFGFTLPLAECTALAAKHGGEACECFYSDRLYFLRFCDFDKAVAFANSEDFARLSTSLDKV